MKNQIRIAVIDDEKSFTSGVVPMIRQCFEEQNMRAEVESFTGTDRFLEQRRDFDLLFLDIDMPGMNGIELASELRQNGSEAALIFVSAHDSFVFESIQYAPLRFIRKRFLERELPEAISAYCRMLQRDRMQVALLLEHGEEMGYSVTKIAGFYAIRHDLFLLDSKGESTMLMPRRYTMEQLEDMMQPHGFLRVHKSYLVNYRFIYQVRQDRILLTLPSDQQPKTIPMSRRRTLQIREAYHALLGKGDALSRGRMMPEATGTSDTGLKEEALSRGRMMSEATGTSDTGLKEEALSRGRMMPEATGTSDTGSKEEADGHI